MTAAASSTRRLRARDARLVAVTVAALAGAVLLIVAGGPSHLTAWEAMVLGIVEGVTEYLPISSTGHLVVAGRVLGVGDGSDETALASYLIAIQIGAIAAVLGIYRHRVAQLARGAAARDSVGRRMLVALAIAFTPAALVGVVLGATVKDHLFQPWPIIAAWAIGGVALLIWQPPVTNTTRIEQITRRQALVIGAAQAIALWPGTSRSLVTLVAALLAGLSIAAAVEFSFLLGLATLTAATTWDLAHNGQELLDAYGWATPLLGAVVAFIAATLSVRWMTAYLRQHSLCIFGWYRISIAGLAVALLLTRTI